VAAKWQPTVTHLVAGAIRYSQYDFFKSRILKMITSTKGASTDTSQTRSYPSGKDGSMTQKSTTQTQQTTGE
jgi:menaquinone-dependent protoporphyrinogen IX oxidase